LSEKSKSDEYSRIRADNEVIGERLQEGTARHEPVTVYFRDGKQHTVQVYALSSRQFRQATKASGVTSGEMQQIGKDAKTPGMMDRWGDKVWDFLQAIAEAAVKDPPNILDVLLPNEEAAIALKAVEMSQIPKQDSTSSSSPSVDPVPHSKS